MSTWPVARRRVVAEAAAQLAQYDQVIAAFRDLGRTYEVQWAEYAAGWVRLYGVDTVSSIRLRLLRKMLKAALSEL